MKTPSLTEPPLLVSMVTMKSESVERSVMVAELRSPRTINGDLGLPVFPFKNQNINKTVKYGFGVFLDTT